MKSNIKWIIIFTALCVVCAVIWTSHTSRQMSGLIAQIKQGNKVIQTIDLSNVKKPYEIVISDEHGGSNKIRVERGKIAVIEADCPDKICVKQGFISSGAVPIVCLPHKLSITIKEKTGGIDAVTGMQKFRAISYVRTKLTSSIKCSLRSPFYKVNFVVTSNC